MRQRNFVFLVMLGFASLSFAADSERVNELGQNFVCVCGGCGQVLMSCNHLGCPSRQAMLQDLAHQIDQGRDDRSIIGYFVQKYGTTVMSVPSGSGFDLTAWIMPFAALASGATTVLMVVRRFRSNWKPPKPCLIKYREKIEEELASLQSVD